MTENNIYQLQILDQEENNVLPAHSAPIEHEEKPILPTKINMFYIIFGCIAAIFITIVLSFWIVDINTNEAYHQGDAVAAKLHKQYEEASEDFIKQYSSKMDKIHTSYDNGKVNIDDAVDLIVSMQEWLENQKSTHNWNNTYSKEGTEYLLDLEDTVNKNVNSLGNIVKDTLNNDMNALAPQREYFTVDVDTLYDSDKEKIQADIVNPEKISKEYNIYLTKISTLDSLVDKIYDIQSRTMIYSNSELKSIQYSATKYNMLYMLLYQTSLSTSIQEELEKKSQEEWDAKLQELTDSITKEVEAKDKLEYDAKLREKDDTIQSLEAQIEQLKTVINQMREK